MRTRSGPPMTPLRERDLDQRDWAARLSEVFPYWLIMWGTWSRCYWGYPRFRVPRGSIVCAADPGGADA